MYIKDKSRIHFIILLGVNCHLCRSFSPVCLLLLRSFTTFTTPYILDIKGVIRTIKSLFTMIRVLCIIYTTFQWSANVIIVALPAHFICAAASKTIARRSALGCSKRARTRNKSWLFFISVSSLKRLLFHLARAFDISWDVLLHSLSRNFVVVVEVF